MGYMGLQNVGHDGAPSLTHSLSLGSDVSREATRRQNVNMTQGGKSH